MAELNATHDPSRRSWVESGNTPLTDFPIQNLPFAVFQRSGEPARGGVAIGDQVIDLKALAATGLLEGVALQAAEAAGGASLLPLLELGRHPASALRARLSDLMRPDGPDARRAQRLAGTVLAPLRAVELLQPARPPAFTDFCCSTWHIDRMGAGRTAQPAWRSLPVSYNGRASSVKVSGTPVVRPLGQFATPGAKAPTFGPEPSLDFELEFGAWLCGGTTLGQPIGVDAAAGRVFGYSLVNDWSARGVQSFETVLGPHLGKSFLTTVSPWIVTDEALEPFRMAAPGRPEGDPPAPAHLTTATDRARGGLDVRLSAELATPAMRAAGIAAEVIVRTNLAHLYWTMGQMVTHLCSNGCPLDAGDLVASGTVSGPDDSARACLAELTRRGGEPIELSNGEARAWLQDGDLVGLRGRAVRDGFVSLGFGACDGMITAAPTWPG